MKNDKRRLKRIWHTDAKRTPEHVELTFHGASVKSDRTTLLVVPMPWDFLPYLVRDIKKEWDAERARRMREIASVDECLPKNPAP